ncbi:holin [Bacillus phage Novomoskovsk]|uniref:Holin n=1 Tax=Bacillus phage Novomoskovsk TaxID=2736258 RepID=A0A6M9Z8X7_9CAUD|nr:holin [Bacillus phage Novomoskovsk]
MKKDWWKSKKLGTAFGALVFVILTDVLAIPIDEQTFWALVTVLSSYILGQGAVDVVKEKKKDEPEEPTE